QGDQHRYHHPHESRLPQGQPLPGARGSSETRLIPLCMSVIRRSRCSLGMTIALGLLFPSVGQAQSPPWIRLGAQGVLLYTRVDPVPRDHSLGEIRATQVAVMAHAGAFSNRLRLLATVNLEGLTMPDGELTPGAWGEGFIDRRHPHTYLHEL